MLLNTTKYVKELARLKVTETDKIADLINKLRNQYLLAANNDGRIELVLDQLRENIINKIRDEELTDEMYEKLLDNVLNTARYNNHHILHRDIINASLKDVKDKVKKNSDSNSDKIKSLNSFLEYAAAKTRPDLNIINILLINGASMHASKCGMNPDGRSKSTRDYFLESSNLDLPDKSIFTIMKEAHKVLFNFSIMKGGMNLAEVLSVVPSKFAEFKGDEKNKPILTRVGEKGEKKLMELLNDYKKLIEKKESGKDTRNIAEKLWSKLLNIFGKSANNQVKKDYTSVYKKLDECIEVGYLAVATDDDKVIIDYARVVKKEQKDERDEDVKELYDIFLTILFEHQDLVKLSWKEVIPYRFKRFVKWNPAWEEILTSQKLKDVKYNIPELNDVIPDLKDKKYDTRASEWSHNNYTIMDGKIEKKRLAQSEENAKLKARADRLELKYRAIKAFTKEMRKLDNEVR